MKFLVFAVVLLIVASCWQFSEAQSEPDCNAAPIACPADVCGSILDLKPYCVYSCKQKCHLLLANKDASNAVLCQSNFVRDYGFQPAPLLACAGTGWLSSCAGPGIQILLSEVTDLVDNCT